MKDDQDPRYHTSLLSYHPTY